MSSKSVDIFLATDERVFRREQVEQTFVNQSAPPSERTISNVVTRRRMRLVWHASENHNVLVCHRLLMTRGRARERDSTHRFRKSRHTLTSLPAFDVALDPTDHVGLVYVDGLQKRFLFVGLRFLTHSKFDATPTTKSQREIHR